MSQTEIEEFSSNNSGSDESVDDHQTCEVEYRDSDEEHYNKTLKRKHEGENNPLSQSALAPPDSKEGFGKAQSTSSAAPVNYTVAEHQYQTTANTTVPTLGELAAKKLVDSLLQSDEPVHDIAAMAHHEKLLLSPYIWGEYNRLRHYSCTTDPSEGEVDREPDKQTRENGYILRSRFIEQWSYSDENWQSAAEDDNADRVTTSWNGRDLYRGDSTSPFCLCQCEDQRDRYWGCKKHTFKNQCYLSDCISSPLLYYRLTAVFGMPPACINDQYKTCWEATLRRVGDERSEFYLSESAGSSQASFRGSVEASESAFKLLCSLVSDNIPHAYDGILAGSIAKEVPKKTAPQSNHHLRHSISDDQHDQLLSPDFWKEYRELRNFESNHKPTCNGHYFPDADKVLAMHNGSTIPDVGEEDSDHPGRENGHALRGEFLRLWGFYPNSSRSWSYRPYQYSYGPVEDSVEKKLETICWVSDDLYRDDETSGFQICDCNEGLDPGLDCKKHPRDKCRRLYDYISSQLLYYRLTAIYEMPPAVPTDENKSYWKATLFWYSDKGSCLIFEEGKGRAKASFKGSSVTSDSALKLLDWLVSDIIPHTYDGILAGTCA